MEIRRLKINAQIGIEQLEELLAGLHYQKKEYVALPGEFAVRGGVVDIYPVTYRLPVRVQFRGDMPVQIRDFSLASGESTATFEEVFLIQVTDVFRKKLRRMEERLETFEPTGPKDLERGDLIVHLKYGIGRYLGTKMIQMQKVKTRCMAIEYAEKEILYLAIEEPVERYIGGSGAGPKLTKLNTQEWERVKHRTRTALHQVAKDLLQIQAKRSTLKGLAFPQDAPWQKQFEGEFPFEETPGQQRAIEEVKKDMESTGPMDRLLCGDVGYGKTEVAMRAAFKAVMGGKQVAFLVPTTILAEQHYILLKERAKSFPVTVELLSRFQSPKEQKMIAKSLQEGSTDVVIGTHRLLSKDIRFKDLGLVIIDEEQRFGVRHKEKLKQMRTQVDVLTLTATPIPRTLHMALLGVRDMSVIDTPPKSRMPVETFVMEYHENIIKQAIERELARQGQVYFVHNRVQSIERVHERLQTLMPGVRFGVMHGQMPVESLETVMKAFLKGEVDCLISTCIVESGIDIPNVNTLIVDRADCFGLADLYQLRGRVGRFKEKRQAYAYFLIPKNWVMTQDAQKRLHAIEKFTQLGSGFKIAMEDLEIRGAGNLLGHEQSGFIQAVGFDLYCRMLKKAVEEQKTGSGGRKADGE
jgi:transcription-repair coupling factor (superfamily II helicase)